MNGQPAGRDWTPVSQAWQRDPDDRDLWRRVAAMPALAFNRIELELLGVVAGRRLCVCGAGDSLAALALAAMGGRVQVVDPSSSLLDLLMVRTQCLGLEIEYVQAELDRLAGVRNREFSLAYAAHLGAQLADLGAFYAAVFGILAPGGRLIVNEYHPFRRVWAQEPGAPRLAYPYFERRRERTEIDGPSPVNPGTSLARYEHHWTVSDHFHWLVRAGFRVEALEEVGDIRQKWEIPNLRGLPEQLVLGADKPA